jgi:hypothetical protein
MLLRNNGQFRADRADMKIASGKLYRSPSIPGGVRVDHKTTLLSGENNTLTPEASKILLRFQIFTAGISNSGTTSLTTTR